MLDPKFQTISLPGCTAAATTLITTTTTTTTTTIISGLGISGPTPLDIPYY